MELICFAVIKWEKRKGDRGGGLLLKRRRRRRKRQKEGRSPLLSPRGMMDDTGEALLHRVEVVGQFRRSQSLHTHVYTHI